MKVIFFVAHDDDLILSSAGLIQKLLADENEVFVVLFTNGETSHQVVLGIEKEPSPYEVAMARRHEFLSATQFLGIALGNIFFLEFPTRQVSSMFERGKERVFQILQQVAPDAVYFHFPDVHIDHQGVSKIVSAVSSELPKKPAMKQFFVWTKELAKDRPEINPAIMPEIPQNVIRLSLTAHELAVKRQALFQMRSQVENWPYPEWQPQKAPILDTDFVNYFLHGEEIFLVS